MLRDLHMSVYKALANDEELLSLMGLTGATNLDKSKRIQKKSKPNNLLTALPLLTFYTPGGVKDRKNTEVFNANYTFDVYTKNDENLAMNIIDRVSRIFHRKLIETVDNLPNFEGEWIDEFESNTDLQDTYCYSCVISISVEIVT